MGHFLDQEAGKDGALACLVEAARHPLPCAGQVTLVGEPDRDEPQLGAVRDVVGHGLENDRVAEGHRSRSGLGQVGDEALADDGQAGLREHALGIVLVNGGSGTPGEQRGEPPGATGPRAGRLRRLGPAREAIDRAETLSRPSDHGNAALAKEGQHVAAEDAGARRHVVEGLR